jgi:hypothetical protein
MLCHVKDRTGLVGQLRHGVCEAAMFCSGSMGLDGPAPERAAQHRKGTAAPASRGRRGSLALESIGSSALQRGDWFRLGCSVEVFSGSRALWRCAEGLRDGKGAALPCSGSLATAYARQQGHGREVHGGHRTGSR